MKTAFELYRDSYLKKLNYKNHETINNNGFIDFVRFKSSDKR